MTVSVHPDLVDRTLDTLEQTTARTNDHPVEQDDTLIARRSAYALMGRVVMAACRGLGLVLVSRTLGAAAFGEYSLIVASYAIASGLGTLGLDQAHVYFVGRGRRPASMLRNAVWTSLVFGMVSGILLLLGANLLREHIFNGTPWRALQITALVLPGILLQNTLSGMTIGKAWFRYHGLLESGKWMFHLLLISLFMARSHLGIETALLALYIPIVLANVVHITALLSTREQSPWWSLFGLPERRGLREVTRFGVKACAINVTHALHMRLDVYLIKYFLESSAQVGQYALAVSITDVLLYLGRSVGLVLFAQRAAQPSVASRSGPRVARVAAGVILACALLLIACVKPLVTVLFGSEFGAATGAVLCRLPGLLGETIAFVFVGELLGLARMGPVFLATAVAVVVGALLNWTFVPVGGIVAAACAFSAASWIRLAIITRAHARESGDSMMVYLRPTRGDLQGLRTANETPAVTGRTEP
jgi:O-antigen/teichoic acid export membrane protein